MLPQEMLQHEINRFLDPVSRGDFNATLKPDERVYKKLSADDIIIHHNKTMLNAHERLVENFSYMFENVGFGSVYRRYGYSRSAEKKLLELFSFWMNPLNAIGIMYERGAKECAIDLFESWCDEDPANKLFEDLDDGGALIREQADAGLAYVMQIPFIRQVRPI